MREYQSAIQYKEGKLLLFEGSYKAVPFNIFISVVLSIYLYYGGIPIIYLVSWVGFLITISLARMVHCSIVVKKKSYLRLRTFHLRIFIILCLANGIAWTSIYFLTLPFATKLESLVLIVSFAGMVSGATATLAVYLPAYFAFILSIFVPVIIYNMLLMSFDGEILAIIFIIYVLGVTVVARNIQKMLRKTFYLIEQNKLLADKLSELSITDSMTGLLNRRTYMQTLKTEQNRAKRNHHNYTLLYLDIDNFKLINDTLGHPFGDQFLKYFSLYIQHYIRRENDKIFRLGGDEFAVLLVNVDKKQVNSLCNTLLSNLFEEPTFDFEKKTAKRKRTLKHVSLSIGANFVNWDSKDSIDCIMEKADRALYDAKSAGKDQCVLVETK